MAASYETSTGDKQMRQRTGTRHANSAEQESRWDIRDGPTTINWQCAVEEMR